MRKQELIQKLEELEWEDFEVKEAKFNVPKNCWNTVSAFSNSNGGWLVFGIKQIGNHFEIQGVNNSEKIEQEFTTTLRGDKFNQKIIAKLKRYNVNNKKILAFYIPLSEMKPVYFNSRRNTFIRTGSGNQRATDAEIDAMFRDSAYGTKDRQLTELEIKDIDKETIHRYRTYLQNINPGHKYSNLSDIELLEKLRVIINGKISIGGLLVFGNEDSVGKVFSDFRIDYFEIMGTSYSDAPKRYEYRMPEYKNLYEYFFAIYERLIKKIDIPFKLKGAFRDENQPQVKAIREALVNLLIHADYFSPMKPRIRVFLNRIEFFNPGALPKPLEELKKGDISLPRNPVITKIFRVINLAENAGYGFDKMFSGWKGYYNKEPEVEGSVDYYKIIFNFKSGGLNGGLSGGLSGGLKDLFILIQNNPGIQAKTISENLNRPIDTIDKQIKKLVEKNLIERKGSRKTGGYWAKK